MTSCKFYYQYVLFLISPTRITFHANLTVLDLTTLKAFRKEYELPESPNYVNFSSLLLHHLTQFQICPSALFSNIPYLCSYCNVRDQISDPYGTASGFTEPFIF